MSQATIHLLDSRKMVEFYVNKDVNSLAVGLFVEGFYANAGTVNVGELVGEDAAEEVFDLTNNPGRQQERAQTYGRGRSVSVGDMIEIDGDLYVCAPCGWEAIDISLI